MASRGVNKVILIGHLGQDVEVRYMPNQNAANPTVATSESWKDQSGQMQERTEWHRVVMYRRLAEIAGEYLRKGSKVYLEGRLQTRKWQDQNGQERYTTEIVANEMQMLEVVVKAKVKRKAVSKVNTRAKRNLLTKAIRVATKAVIRRTDLRQQAKALMHRQSKPASKPAADAFTPDLNEGWDDDIPF